MLLLVIVLLLGRGEQGRLMLRLFWKGLGCWFLMVWVALSGFTGCSQTIKVPTPSIPKTPSSRSCPDKLAGSNAVSTFQASLSPCALNSPQTACTQGCLPQNVPSQSTKAGSNFFSECNKPEVICVRPGTAISTLTEAAKQVQQNSVITKVLVASGLYKESATFQNITRSLTIEGESNDPKNGVRIEAPAPTGSPNPTYAALQFITVQDVTLKRLALLGNGHGLYVKGARFVIIDGSHHTENLRTGAWIQDAQKLQVVRSRFTYNGGTLQANKGYEQLRAGLRVEGTPDVSLQDSEFARNGAVGFRIGTSLVGVIIDGSHRIAGYEQAGVIIDGSHRVGVTGCSVHHNGPVGRADSPTQNCTASCGAGFFCEGNQCHPNLQANVPPGPNVPKNAVALVGVGGVIAGVGQVTVQGNSFFGNDTTAMMLHSANVVDIQENAVERNGVRPASSTRRMQVFAYPALSFWNLTQSLNMQNNLLTDNVTSGIQLSHMKGTGSTMLKVTADFNHIGGNGRFLLSSNTPLGDGLSILTEQSRAMVSLKLQGNYFTQNGRSGLFTTGAVDGDIDGNYFETHPFRALVLHDTGSNTSNTIQLSNNAIQGARGYGLQIHGGSAGISIQNNLIKDLQTTTNVTEADGINLTQLTSSQIKVSDNLIQNVARAGILVDKTKIQASNNLIQTSKFPIVTQQQAQVSGNNASQATSPSSPLPNRKEF